jgi:radical SAM superfamily enzyme YgiQ (UPF0313 family)
MRVLLINLPSRHRLMRRYVASYYAPNFLIPPLELMGLGAVARRLPGWEVRLLDCMAAGLDQTGALARIRALDPDVLVTMSGFEVCGDDLDTLAAIRRANPRARIFIFGYLPTQLPEQVLRHEACCEGILLDEPEPTFEELLLRVQRGEPLAGMPGLACLDPDGELSLGPPRGRIRDLDALPWADHTLIDLSAYSESFMPRPTGAIMTARGCSFSCTYCVRTYGRKVVYRSAESLAAEIASLRRMGIPHVRFLDDTFTLKRDRVLELCERLSRQERGLTWTALTRLDTMDATLARRMYHAGCRRVYVGVESASQRVLDLYKKKLTVERVREALPMVRAAGIEVCTFFIVGAPGETPAEIEASIELALELDPDYIIVTRIQYWPGTDLYQQHQSKLDFTLFPTSCEPLPGKGIMSHEEYMRWEKAFYRRFYLRPRYVLRRIGTLARTPRDVLEGLGELGAFVANRTRTRDFI